MPRPSAMLRSRPRAGPRSGTGSWASRVALAGAVLVCALALAVLAGWLTGDRRLTQVQPTFAAMQVGAALGFLLAGLALAGAVLRRDDVVVACGAAVTVLGVVTLAQYALEVDLGLDRLLHLGEGGAPGTPYPGRMAPNSALGFVMSGVALVALRPAARTGAGVLLSAGLGLATAGVGGLALFGYVTGIGIGYTWGGLNTMAVHTAAGMVLLGSCIGAFALQAALTGAVLAESWLPLCAAAAVAGFSLLPAYAWLSHDRLQRLRAIEEKAEQLNAEIKDAVDAHVQALERMARRWVHRRGTPPGEWRVDAAVYVADLAGYRAIAWADASGRVRMVVPESGNEALVGEELAGRPGARRALERIATAGDAVLTAVFTDAGGRRRFDVLAALVGPGFADGVLVGIIDPQALLDTELAHARALGYDVEIRQAGRAIYRHSPAADSLVARWRYQRTLDVPVLGTTWELRLVPTARALAGISPVLPYLAAGLGMLLAVLLGLTIHLAQTARRRARAAEYAQDELAAARRRSDLILDAAGEGICGLDVLGRVTFVNTAGVRMLGWSASELMTKAHGVVHHPESAGPARHQCPMQQACVDGLVHHVGNDVFWRRDGYPFPVEYTSTPIFDGNGKPAGAVVTFRDITERQQAEAALNALNRTLEERVAQRTALAERRAQDLVSANAELARANADLERINKELDDFAYIASHDLKEPLRGISSYATFLLEDHGERLDDNGRGKVETMIRLTRRLSGLIDALLHFSRLGRIDPTIEDVDLDDLVGETVDLLRGRLDEEHVELRVRHPLPRLRCDRLWAGELLANLITNAIKYNDKPHKWIEIGVEPAAIPGEPPAVYVRDNGIGIPERHFDTVFRIFKRLHGREKFGGGTGAGLTIAKRIVERHGGRIWIESRPGEGTAMYFTFGEADESETRPRGVLERVAQGAGESRGSDLAG